MIGPRSPYTDNVGRYRTKSLFLEEILQQQLDNGIIPVYTFRKHEDYIDIHELYLSLGDPTEYQFAISAFGTWQHFEYISSLRWFKKHLEMWRTELEIKMRSEALTTIMEVAATEGTKGITAAKWIADRGWDKKRGRPSKEEVQREKKVQAGIHEDISDDAKRLGLH